MLCICLHLSLESLGGVSPNFGTMTKTEKEWFWTYIEKKDNLHVPVTLPFFTSFDLTKLSLLKKHVSPFSYQTCAQVYPDEVSA